MKAATWNVNSIKARLPNVLDWLQNAAPDVVMLQETKSIDDTFPRLEIEDLGYNIAVHGQKSYNGRGDPLEAPDGRRIPGLAG